MHQVEAVCGRERSGSPQPKSREFFTRDLLKRLAVALAAFLGLAVLSWTTLSDQRIRLVTLAILAMFAFKTWVHRKDAIDVGDKGK